MVVMNVIGHGPLVGACGANPRESDVVRAATAKGGERHRLVAPEPRNDQRQDIEQGDLGDRGQLSGPGKGVLDIERLQELRETVEPEHGQEDGDEGIQHLHGELVDNSLAERHPSHQWKHDHCEDKADGDRMGTRSSMAVAVAVGVVAVAVVAVAVAMAEVSFAVAVAVAVARIIRKLLARLFQLDPGLTKLLLSLKPLFLLFLEVAQGLLALFLCLLRLRRSCLDLRSGLLCRCLVPARLGHGPLGLGLEVVRLAELIGGFRYDGLTLGRGRLIRLLGGLLLGLLEGTLGGLQGVLCLRMTMAVAMTMLRRMRLFMLLMRLIMRRFVLLLLRNFNLRPVAATAQSAIAMRSSSLLKLHPVRPRMRSQRDLARRRSRRKRQDGDQKQGLPHRRLACVLRF
mmetsp:Transcript_33532/g.71267  ORF Transcript_33532/g.71267 Transcript_33532/m.71267 type:complete len:400 (-) Transcript_33532:36-1235(-)